MIKIKRIYESYDPSDGIRLLVERLWPRGIKKEVLRIDAWLKDVAPSNELRKWFGHDPSKWDEFKRRYWEELDKNQKSLDPIRSIMHNSSVSLLFSSHDEEHNNAVALKEYIEFYLKD